MAVTNQNCVSRSHYNKIVHAEQCDIGPGVIEDDVVSRINRSQRAISGILMLVALEIFSHRSPATDVVPIKTRFYDQDAIRLFQDRIVE